MALRTKTLLALLTFVFANPALAYRVQARNNQSAAQDDAALVDVTQQVQQLTMTSNSPVVYNKCKMPLAVYLARGFLFNKQVILPGEAAQLYSPEKGPFFAPYHIVAIVGDENALPGDLESLLHFIGKAAVPTAFVGGVAVSIISWGALTGPALALGPLVSNAPMIMGYTLGAVDIAAGAAAAKIAENVAENGEYYNTAAKYIVGNHSKAFMAKTSWVFAGESYFEVVGGPDEATGTKPDDLQIKKIDARTYNSYQVETVKLCQALSTRGSSGTHSFTISGCGNPAMNGRWRMGPDHNDRPSYFRYDEEDLVIEWSSKNSKWRATTISKPMGGIFRSRTTFYMSDASDMWTIPDHGWSTVSGSGEAPTVTLAVAFTITNCGDQRMNGDWAHVGEHNDRLQYGLINGDEDDEIVIEYSWKRGIWRATTTGGWWRTTLYSSSSNSTFAEGGSTVVPASGWTVVDGTAPAPQFEMA